MHVPIPRSALRCVAAVFPACGGCRCCEGWRQEGPQGPEVPENFEGARGGAKCSTGVRGPPDRGPGLWPGSCWGGVQPCAVHGQWFRCCVGALNRWSAAPMLRTMVGLRVPDLHPALLLCLAPVCAVPGDRSDHSPSPHKEDVGILQGQQPHGPRRQGRVRHHAFTHAGYVGGGEAGRGWVPAAERVPFSCSTAHGAGLQLPALVPPSRRAGGAARDPPGGGPGVGVGGWGQATHRHARTHVRTHKLGAGGITLPMGIYAFLPAPSSLRQCMHAARATAPTCLIWTPPLPPPLCDAALRAVRRQAEGVVW